MKRKDQPDLAQEARPAKRAATSEDIKQNFRKGLFSDQIRDDYTSAYANSKPYKHGVIDSLIEDDLLRAVRDEITTNISFTPKETDIYKIHQSGDLANLDGLDDSSLSLLPSLITLRDSLYSADFRQYLAKVTGSGPLSGNKTDMAVNVYTPGCHLLCHDDVIGTRRVSYILYLTDPDKPWRAGWGGALRLYPTENHTLDNGQIFKVPHHTHTVSIPPAFGQLSFFAVQPGESFHDVEEVYARKEGEAEDDGGRVRMAISGWFHIPQEGEEGYDPEAEAAAAEKSSLSQLQGKSDKFDAPQTIWLDPEERDAPANGDPIGGDEGESDLTEADLTFLLQFMNPRYLVPDTVASLADTFSDDCSLRLALFLSDKFSAALREQVTALDSAASPQPDWTTATPPHKHRYLFAETTAHTKRADPATDPHAALYTALLPSRAFQKWLALATGLALGECAVRARRFRRGRDYSLATGYDAHEPQLELCLGLTPTRGWGADAVEEPDADADAAAGAEAEAEASTNGHAAHDDADDEDANVGGYEAYMAADEPDEAGAAAAAAGHDTSTGAGDRRSGRKGGRADPAVYQGGGEADADEGVLFSSGAGWNALSVVLRDAGVLRFVKYVSAAARGDRWDVVGEWRVEEDEEDDEDEDEEAGGAEA